MTRARTSDGKLPGRVCPIADEGEVAENRRAKDDFALDALLHHGFRRSLRDKSEEQRGYGHCPCSERAVCRMHVHREDRGLVCRAIAIGRPAMSRKMRKLP